MGLPRQMLLGHCAMATAQVPPQSQYTHAQTHTHTLSLSRSLSLSRFLALSRKGRAAWLWTDPRSGTSVSWLRTQMLFGVYNVVCQRALDGIPFLGFGLWVCSEPLSLLILSLSLARARARARALARSRHLAMASAVFDS